MGLSLETTFQCNNEGMIDALKDLLLTLYMINLLQSDDLCLLKHFESHGITLRIVLVSYKSHSAKGTSS
jgi:hypothetical protein